LIFGSRRPGGYGEGDIYIATARIQGGWRVENLGPPVSSAANELEAEMSRDGSVLIVVSSREARWHLYRYERSGTGWIERGRVPANDEVFQVGPLLSPSGDKLLFAQATSALSGEIFLTRLAAERDPGWPPRCERR
jgi:Tol biopolymer transport system component